MIQMLFDLPGEQGLSAYDLLIFSGLRPLAALALISDFTTPENIGMNENLCKFGLEPHPDGIP